MELIQKNFTGKLPQFFFQGLLRNVLRSYNDVYFTLFCFLILI